MWPFLKATPFEVVFSTETTFFGLHQQTHLLWAWGLIPSLMKFWDLSPEILPTWCGVNEGHGATLLVSGLLFNSLEATWILSSKEDRWLGVSCADSAWLQCQRVQVRGYSLYNIFKNAVKPLLGIQGSCIVLQGHLVGATSWGGGKQSWAQTLKGGRCSGLIQSSPNNAKWLGIPADFFTALPDLQAAGVIFLMSHGWPMH